MCVTLIGGMDRLQREYEETARADGHMLKFISRNERDFIKKLGHPDVLVVFTNKILHEAKRKATEFARRYRIPLKLAHSCGISTLKEILR